MCFELQRMSNLIDWTESCLPDDCLLLIHQKLQNRDDRDAFGLTCKRWLHIQNMARTQLVFDFSFNPRRQQEYPQYIQRLLIRFPYLSKLSLAGCTDLPDSALTPLMVSWSSLKYLSLYCCFNITDAGLSLLSTGCRNLETLNVYRCNITDAGLETIAGSCHILKNVNLSNCSSITDRGLNALCNGCPKLYALIITSCKGITGTGLKGSPPTLTYLEAETCMLSSEGLREAMSGGGLQYLNLSHPRNLSRHGDGLGHIGSGYAQRLRFLNLRMCRHMSDESASAIAKGCPVLEEWNLAICHGIRLLGWLAIGSNCKKLRVLHVNRCKNLCNQGLNALRVGCDRLEVLYIHGCKGVTNTGLEIFRMYRFNVELRREECATMLIIPCVARLFL
ncbi:F-box/LRR-repeat protein 12 [Carex littledalei]|uniref:F-box/LRR-repeat protein 12 n=1 Tax=Carex littledalei TaxID=544730 RepID=A0A833VQ71_9POAL|nr:F-box/LRR-repeat protein 12 [Carex littledalei]